MKLLKCIVNGSDDMKIEFLTRILRYPNILLCSTDTVVEMNRWQVLLIDNQTINLDFCFYLEYLL